MNSFQDHLNEKDVVIQSKESLYQSTVDKADVWRDLANSLREQVRVQHYKRLIEIIHKWAKCLSDHFEG